MINYFLRDWGSKDEFALLMSRLVEPAYMVFIISLSFCVSLGLFIPGAFITETDDASIYSPYSYTGVDASPPPTADLGNLEEVRDTGSGPRAIVSEVFLFEYGVTVIWGMTESEEKRFLKEITKFEIESLRTPSPHRPYFASLYSSISILCSCVSSFFSCGCLSVLFSFDCGVLSILWCFLD